MAISREDWQKAGSMLPRQINIQEGYYSVSFCKEECDVLHDFFIDKGEIEYAEAVEYLKNNEIIDHRLSSFYNQYSFKSHIIDIRGDHKIFNNVKGIILDFLFLYKKNRDEIICSEINNA